MGRGRLPARPASGAAVGGVARVPCAPAPHAGPGAVWPAGGEGGGLRASAQHPLAGVLPASFLVDVPHLAAHLVGIVDVVDGSTHDLSGLAAAGWGEATVVLEDHVSLDPLEEGDVSSGREADLHAALRSHSRTSQLLEVTPCPLGWLGGTGALPGGGALRAVIVRALDYSPRVSYIANLVSANFDGPYNAVDLRGWEEHHARCRCLQAAGDTRVADVNCDLPLGGVGRALVAAGFDTLVPLFVFISGDHPGSPLPPPPELAAAGFSVVTLGTALAEVAPPLSPQEEVLLGCALGEGAHTFAGSLLSSSSFHVVERRRALGGGGGHDAVGTGGEGYLDGKSPGCGVGRAGGCAGERAFVG